MRIPFLLGLFLLPLLALSCTLFSSQRESTPTPEGEALPKSSSPIPRPPDLDRYDLTRRLRLQSQEAIPRVVNPLPTSYQVGHRQTFWLLDMETYERFTVDATLLLVTPHAYFYVEEEIQVDERDVEKAAREFESRVYPTVTRYFGSEWSPGVDNDLHLTILHARIPGVAGYYSPADEYPQVVYPFSNEREMIYVNIDGIMIGSRDYYAVLAHELQHAIHWRADSTEEGWVDEGLAELAADLAGYRAGFVPSFASSPDTQLNAWEEDIERTPPHYGAAYLFMKYLFNHYGGEEALRELLELAEDGLQGIDRYLAQRGYQVDFDTVFRDWTIANYLDDPQGGIYSYPDTEVRVRSREIVAAPLSISATVHQYAADYVDIRLTQGDVLVSFQGSPETKLLPQEAFSGAYQWWSNRGDAIDSILTQEFDLSALERATLTFWTWYEIEEDWDYAYVEVSQDGGLSWSILEGKHTKWENTIGNSYGPAYTGVSGGGDEPRWVQESIDLSPYIGGKILLRFEYVTDEAVNGNGFCLDDISIPELGYFDDVESDGGWEVEGFARTDNVLDQLFMVRLIEFGKEIRVREIRLDSAQRGEVIIQGFGDRLDHAVLVVAAMAPSTTQEAHYSLSIDPF